MAPPKKKKIGIIFGYGLGDKAGTFRKDSSFGGGPDLQRFGGMKPRDSGIAGAFINIEVQYSLARREFFQFCGDLWIAIVRNSVWHPFATGPSPLGMIYTRIKEDGIDFGWRNYPTRKKNPKADDMAKVRFDMRASIFEGIVAETGTRWFTTGAQGDKTTRDTIANARVQAAIRQSMVMKTPTGEDQAFQVPIRSGQRKNIESYSREMRIDRAHSAEARHREKIMGKLTPRQRQARFPDTDG